MNYKGRRAKACDWVRCITNEIDSMTFNKLYKVIEADEDTWRLINDNGEADWWGNPLSKFFELVPKNHIVRDIIKDL